MEQAAPHLVEGTDPTGWAIRDGRMLQRGDGCSREEGSADSPRPLNTVRYFVFFSQTTNTKDKNIQIIVIKLILPFIVVVLTKVFSCIGMIYEGMFLVWTPRT